jgi:hypothetical protein
MRRDLAGILNRMTRACEGNENEAIVVDSDKQLATHTKADQAVEVTIIFTRSICIVRFVDE